MKPSVCRETFSCPWTGARGDLETQRCALTGRLSSHANLPARARGRRSVRRAPSLQAADKTPIAVYTDPHQTDADFPLQGEYLGYQRSPAEPPAAASSWGLQVIAVGDGKFEAVKFFGGLPGTTSWRRERIPLLGERRDDVLHLKGTFTTPSSMASRRRSTTSSAKSRDG